MPSRAEVEAFADANRGLRELVLAALRGFWQGLDHLDAVATRDALLEVVPLLVAQYGDVAAAVAADFYESSRASAGVPGRFTAVLADPVNADDVRGDVRWSVGPLFSRENPDPTAALGRLEQKVDELTLQPGRDTIAHSAGRDPAKARWARVPVGKTCAFCLLTASRGAVYRSAESAGRARKFHANDDCQAVPFWPGDSYPEGYNPDALLQQYMDARKAAVADKGSDSTKAILSSLREQTGGH